MRFKLLAALFAALLLSACNEPHTGTFVFTAIPDQDESQLEKRFGVVALYLEEQLGVPVKYVPVKSYAAAVTAFRNNEVQMAWFGGLSGVQARRLVPGSQAIAQGLEDPDFKSYFIANTSTGLTQSDTLPESFIDQPSFTFGSKGSTSGRLMPEFYLRETFNQAPDQLFDKVGFSGDHSATIALVQSGAYEIGALSYQVWDKEVADGTVDTDKAQVIWTTPPYPDYHWVIRGDVDATFGEGFADKVQRALLELDDRDVLDAFPREKFIPATNDDFLPILDTARSLGLMD